MFHTSILLVFFSHKQWLRPGDVGHDLGHLDAAHLWDRYDQVPHFSAEEEAKWVSLVDFEKDPNKKVGEQNAVPKCSKHCNVFLFVVPQFEFIVGCNLGVLDSCLFSCREVQGSWFCGWNLIWIIRLITCVILYGNCPKDIRTIIFSLCSAVNGGDTGPFFGAGASASALRFAGLVDHQLIRVARGPFWPLDFHIVYNQYISFHRWLIYIDLYPTKMFQSWCLH